MHCHVVVLFQCIFEAIHIVCPAHGVGGGIYHKLWDRNKEMTKPTSFHRIFQKSPQINAFCSRKGSNTIKFCNNRKNSVQPHITSLGAEDADVPGVPMENDASNNIDAQDNTCDSGSDVTGGTVIVNQLILRNHSEPFDISTMDTDESIYKKKLSRRLFVKNLFKRIPQISTTESVLVRSKATVKGKVGSRTDLAMGNLNKIKTGECLEEPTMCSSILYPGVYNGMHPLKHTKRRIFRELKVKLDLYAKTLTLQLKNIVTFFEQLLRYIHPFQYQLLRTCFHDCYTNGKINVPFGKLLNELSSIKNELIKRTAKFNGNLYKITKCRDAFNVVKSFIFELDEMYKKGEPLYRVYKGYAAALSTLPTIDPTKPLIAIIGHSNIGKSTLFQNLIWETNAIDVFSAAVRRGEHEYMQRISDTLGLKWTAPKRTTVKRISAAVKIANYFFTTRTLHLIHRQYKVHNFIYDGQIVDTPGLLYKGDNSKENRRNPYEKLTYAVLKDLPTGVIFGFDTTGASCSLEGQIRLYNLIRSRFPHRPWLNVITKSDHPEFDQELLASEGINALLSHDLNDHIGQMLTELHELRL